MKKGSALPPAIFLGGAVPLDFLNSIATPADEVVEWMGNGADFLSWMKQARLLTDDNVATIKQRMSTTQLDAVAKDGRELRDWFRRFIRKHRGRPLHKRALDQVGPLNRLLGSDAVFWQIELAESFRNRDENEDPSPGVFHLCPHRHWHKPESILLPLAEELAKFICSADFRQVKACEGGGCTLLFLDQSHRHGRRWCSMAICGNRAKSAAFAARAKNGKKQRDPKKAK